MSAIIEKKALMFINGDDEATFHSEGDLLNGFNLRFGTSESGKIGGMQPIPSNIQILLSNTTYPLITIYIRAKIGTNYYSYNAYYVQLLNTGAAGYYEITSTAQINSTGIMVYPPYPILGAPPTTVPFSGLSFKGADITSVIFNISGGVTPDSVGESLVTITINKTIITNYNTLPAGTNYGIGWAVDEGGKEIAYFGWNSLGQHYILFYDRNFNQLFIALLNSQVIGSLNFSKYSYIHSSRIVNGCLFWVDSTTNEPRRIDLKAAVNMNYPNTYPSVVPYKNNMSQAVIKWIRRQPSYSPTSTRFYDITFVNNFIQDEAFQFAYYYQYRNFEYSTISGYSLLNNSNRSVENFNEINIVLPVGEKIDQDVINIYLVAIYKNSGKYFVIKTWNSTTDASAIALHNIGTALNFNWYNNIAVLPIDSIFSIKPFDSVPIYSESCDFARNRSFLGGNTMGYDTPTLTSLLLGSIQENDSTTVTGSWYVIHYSGGTATQYFINTYTGFYTYSGTPPPPYPGTIAFGLMTFVASGFSSLAAYIAGSISYPGWDGLINPTGQTSIISGAPPPPGLAGRRCYKSAGSYDGSITFYDEEKRKTGYIKSISGTITIPDRVYNQIQYTTFITWNLSNTNSISEIPVTAKYYSINLTKCLRTRFFLQMRGANAAYANKDASGVYTFTASGWTATASGCAFDITSLDAYQMGYVYTPGSNDLMKIYIAGFEYELKIIGQSGRWVITELKAIGLLDSTVVYLFEIYTPYIRSDAEPHYEVSQFYPVANPGTGTRQYSTIAGQVQGDVTLLTRNTGGVDYLTEAMAPNDKIYKTWYTDSGRPNFIDTIGQQTKGGGIVFTNTFIEGAKVNGLSTFDPLDTINLPSEMGRLRKLQLASKVENDQGLVMLAICEEETASLYIGEVQLISSTQNAFVASAPGVIGTVNILKGSRGTVNPESVRFHVGHVFWFDALNQVFVRYSPNGLFDISDYKFKTFTRKLANKFLSMSQIQIEALGSRPFIIGGVDEYHDEYLVSIPKLENNPAGNLPGLTSIPNNFDVYDGQEKTIVFKMEANRWALPQEYYGECIITMNNNLFVVNHGTLWYHNDPANGFNNLFGINKIPRIMVAGNMYPDHVKVINAITVQSDISPSYGIAMSTLPNVQVTDFDQTIIALKEGDYLTTVRRDVNSPSFLDPNIAWNYGDKIRGKAILVEIDFSGNTFFILKAINLRYQISIGALNVTPKGLPAAPQQFQQIPQ